MCCRDSSADQIHVLVLFLRSSAAAHVTGTDGHACLARQVKLAAQEVSLAMMQSTAFEA